MRCGFYETEITAPLGSRIYGYFFERTAKGVKEKLYAKAAVLESNGTLVALLAIDALYIPEGLPEVAKTRIHEATGIPTDAILIAATHAHTSIPVTTKAVPNQEDRHLEELVLEITALLAADTVILAWQRLQEAYIRFGTGTAEDISFVREFRMKDGNVRTNPGFISEQIDYRISEADKSLPMFYITDANGKPLGMITSFALHHDTVAGEEESSDYSGYVAKKLKRILGEDFVTVFFSGFCGNINSADFLDTTNNRFRSTSYIGDILLQALLSTVANAHPIESDVLSVRTDTTKILKRQLPEGFLEDIHRRTNIPMDTEGMGIDFPNEDRILYATAPLILKHYEVDSNTEYDAPVQVIRIGDCLIYSLVGEVFDQFAATLREASPTCNNLMVELAHSDVLTSYIPPEDMFFPEMYEASYNACFLAPDTGSRLVKKALEIANDLYN